MSPDAIRAAIEYLDRSITNYVEHVTLYLRCRALLEKPEFLQAPGGSTHHHTYRGGLVYHTAQVTRMAIAMANAMHGVNRQVLVTAALWHDVGKIWDYTLVSPDSPIDHDVRDSPHRKLINHLNRSAVEFGIACQDAPMDLFEPILHCILAHHGRPEWGSPVTPRTKEAHILHYADMLSSRFPPDIEVFL